MSFQVGQHTKLSRHSVIVISFQTNRTSRWKNYFFRVSIALTLMREGKKCLKIILLFGKYIGNVEINLLTRSIGGFFVAIDRVGLRGRENDCFESVIANSKDTKGINI